MGPAAPSTCHGDARDIAAAIAAALAERRGRGAEVERDGAARAAGMIAELL